ncbi:MULTISPECIES: hypothetical protein [unclassified Methylobacterium]|uniref:hypothetical protein n=1 Tax=unclassified Methylobacterium TaxID=2615210 RepID=UPI0013538993|nr:hypothetical protein [Methylobacterium sp. 2A]MWV24666.1 hypothetical protein [Methylobacterium sp. 2A]
MTPAEIKARVQGAYREAMGNRSMQRQRSSRIHDLARDARLYGRDAGADSAQMHLGRLVDEAVGMAGCKDAALELTLNGSGRAALEGLAQAPRDLTGLKAEVDGTTVRLIWTEADLGPV